MGAKITGAGQSTIEINGVARLNGAKHRVLPDRIEAGTYAMAVAMTGGDVFLEGARAHDFQAALDLLVQSGATCRIAQRGRARVAKRRADPAGGRGRPPPSPASRPISRRSSWR